MQPLTRTIKLIDIRSGLGDFIHAAPLEVCVTVRRADKTMAWCQGADHLMKIERDLPQWKVEQLRHIAFARPPFDVPIHVIEIGIESTTGNDNPEPLVENCGVDRVVSP